MHPDDRQLLHRSFGCAKKKNVVGRGSRIGVQWQRLEVKGGAMLLSVAGTLGRVAAMTAASICPRNSELGMHLIKCSRVSGHGAPPAMNRKVFF